MPSDPAYIRNVRRFAQDSPTAADLPQLEAELYGSSDRASAVMLASITEAALEVFLRSKVRLSFNAGDMRLLFDFSGILGSFGAKITAAYAFNWFGPETRHDLDLIRVMRNEFAHSRKSFGFTDDPVAAVCKQLKSPDWGCAVTRRRFPVGARPTRRFAPAGSNRSSHGGNEMAEAFD